MALDLRRPDTLRLIDSITKYPSIPTYHTTRNADGKLMDGPPQVRFTGTVTVTEKIDGANARVILLPRETEPATLLIGSRKEILYADGDFIVNPHQGIVETLLPVTDGLTVRPHHPDALFAIFGEVYGADPSLPAGRHYTDQRGQMGFRVFDAMVVSHENLRQMATWTPENIAGWRERGEQSWIHGFRGFGGTVPVPQITRIPADTLPQTLEGTYEWLTGLIDTTRAALGQHAGPAEGIVLRDDHHHLAKIRFADYRRALGKK